MSVSRLDAARQAFRKVVYGMPKEAACTMLVDCTPWVTGGLWPAELSPSSAEIASLARHLKADLQRIVNSANEALNKVRVARIADSVRRAEEARIINDARAFAVRRVESTVRDIYARELLVEHGQIDAVD